MKKIVVIFGGASVEHDVSIITGLQAINNLKESVEVIPIYLSLENKFYLTDKLKPSDYFDKNMLIKSATQVSFFDGKIYKVKKGKLVKFKEFDALVNCCHGGGGENGELYAFLKLNNVNCSSSDTLSSGICMNKYLTKICLKDLEIPVVDGILLTNENKEEKLEEIGKKLKTKLIVKPNSLGSSIGIIKTTKKDLKKTIESVLALDNEVLIENYIENMYELNCSAYLKGGEIVLSQIEKVGSQNDILSFDDKYCSKSSSREIPAKISKELEEKIYKYTKLVYSSLNLSGIIRIDYIYDIDADKLYLNEINTIPGSLAYYLYQGQGLTYSMLCEDMINVDNKEKIQKYFESDILTKTGLKIK